MSQPRQLYQLQQLDTQIDNSLARLNEIDKILSDNSTVQQAKIKLQKAEKNQQQAQIALKHAEQDVESQQTKISNNERALYGGAVKNPKELEDLQLESGALKRHLETLEDRLLEAMVAFEEAEQQHQQAAEYLDQCLEQAASENAELSKEQSELKAALEQLQADKAQQANTIDSESMKIYLDLRKSRAGIAVSEVIDNGCAACGANLTAAQAQAARSPNKITQCDSCRRILYLK